jgi:ADP-heptose:LPS heptosyltransferase
MFQGTGGDGFLSRPLRRVAVVRPGRIGDFLCATPALRALRLAQPGAEITMIGLPLVAELVERSPDADRFEAFPGWPGIAEQFFDPREAVAFLARMQERRFDLAVQLYGSGVNANPFTLLLGARRTAGFVRPGEGPGLLDASLPLPESGHEVDRVLALPLHLGARHPGRETAFPLRPGDVAAAGRLLEGLRPPLLGLHMGARDRERRWPPDHWLGAARAVGRRAGGTLVVVGGEEERAAAEALCAHWGPGAVSLAGRVGLAVLGAVLARLDLLLTTDSGPAHVAYALGAPSVTLFLDPAEAGRYGPPRGGPHAAVVAAGGRAGADSGAAAVDAVVRAAAGLPRRRAAGPARGSAG